MPTKKRTTKKESYINHNLPIFYVDDIDARHRHDGMNYLVFRTSIPNMYIEQVRLMIDDKSLRGIIDDLSKSIDYYPEKKEETE